MKKINISLPANLCYSSSIRGLFGEFATSVGFDSSGVNFLKLSIDELFVNAVRYGSTKDSFISLVGEFKDNKFTFSIEDEGKGKKKLSPKELNVIIKKEIDNDDLIKTSGRGLAQIVGKISSDLKVEESKMGGLRIEFSTGMEDIAKVYTKESGVNIKNNRKSDLKSQQFILSGEIDSENIEEIVEGIIDHVSQVSEAESMVLECKDLKYINTEFIGYLAAWYSVYNSLGGEIVIKNANDYIMETLDLIGLSLLIKFE